MNTKNNFSFPVLEHPAPQCDTNEAHELASEWMETSEDTTITPLVSERDRNFLISTGGEKAILKISNHKEKRRARVSKRSITAPRKLNKSKPTKSEKKQNRRLS